MGLFGKSKRSAPEPAPTPAFKAEVSGTDHGLLDQAMDTVAGLVRTLGRYAFDVASMDREAFGRRCEAWVRHVLTGAPLPKDEPDSSDRDPTKPLLVNDPELVRSPSGRAWKELQQFILVHRREEQSFVESRIGELKDAIWAFIEGLRDIASADTAMETTIEGSLIRLEDAVETGSLEAVRRLVTQTSGAIHQAMQQRRAHFERHMRAMGSKLRALRTDLLEARRMMELDPLTQVYNRGAFDGALQRYVDLSLFAGQSLTMLMIDLDHFKSINDRYGHPVGDRVLVAAAGSMVRAFPRRNDFVARYGGEEFVVLLHDADGAASRRLADRLLERMRQLRVSVDEQEVEVTCSIGLAELRPGERGTDLLARADAALLQAKQNGRDRVEVA